MRRALLATQAVKEERWRWTSRLGLVLGGRRPAVRNAE